MEVSVLSEDQITPEVSIDHGDTMFRDQLFEDLDRLCQFSASRGLPFSYAATLSSSSWVCNDRSVLSVKYCRVARSHEYHAATVSAGRRNRRAGRCGR
jgi:hypothetical protein